MTYRRFDLVSVDAQTRLTEFETAFMQALNSEDTDPDAVWARTYGYEYQTSMLRTRWPIGLDAAGYQKFNGDIIYRDLAHATIELVSELWSDGVAELRRIIEAPEFIGWADAPANMAMARRQKPNELVAALLADGEGYDSWDDGVFFRTGHPFNMKKTSLGTYDNLYTDHAPSIATLKFLRQHFRAIKNASGKNMGLRLTHLVVQIGRAHV